MEELINELKVKIGENLTCVAEYGKIERQDVIVIDKVDFDLLERCKDLLQKWHKKRKKFPLLLTREELKDGMDVFPLEFLDMKLNHRILYGEDVFKTLEFTGKYVRRELEFEFRSKLINLRQGFLEVKGKKEVEVMINKAAPTLLPILQGLLFLKKVKVPGSLNEIFSEVENSYKIKVDVLKEVQGKREKENEYYIKGLMKFLEEIGEVVDEMKI